MTVVLAKALLYTHFNKKAEELASLYKKLGERFRSEKKHMQELLALRENKPAVSLPGDTVDVWYDLSLIHIFMVC